MPRRPPPMLWLPPNPALDDSFGSERSNPLCSSFLALMLACENLIDENDRYREALEKISCPTSMWDGFNAKMYWDIAREALKGE